MRKYKVSRQVGKRIARLRKKQKMSQEEFAFAAGIYLSTLGKIERGENNPGIQTLQKIARALKIHISKLFYF